MDGLHNTSRQGLKRPRRNLAQVVPVVWIMILLGLWFVIGEWKMLPEMVTATMAALP